MTAGPTFEWDEEKARSNLAKHGIRLEAGVAVFDDPFHLVTDDEYAEGEYRFVATGCVDGLMITVVFADGADEGIRLISVRMATGAERRNYEKTPR